MTTNLTRNGAFPYYRWWSVGTTTDGSTPVGNGSTPPMVLSATATDATHVRVSFSQEMYHTNSANLNDATRPGNYVLDNVRNIPTVTNVVVYQANPTIVDLTLDHEMTQDDAYQVQVSNVLNLLDYAIEDGYDYANFEGIGVKPRVFSSNVGSITVVYVQFNEPMNIGVGTQLDNASRYVITGPTTLTVNSVTISNSTLVQLHISGEMLTGGAYTVTVGPPYTGLEDVYFNQLDPSYSSAGFTGEGVAPTVTGAAAVGSTHVTVDFSEAMQDTASLRTAARYVFAGPTTLTAVSVSVTSATRVTVEVTGEVQNGGSYTVTVTPTTGILDLAGNTLSATFNSRTFTGSAPQVSSATATLTTRVVVDFSDAMQNTTEIHTSTNYHISGPTTIVPSTASLTTPTRVTLSWAGYEMRTGATYTVSVSPTTNILDTSGNTLDSGHASATFSGLGYAPRVSSIEALDGHTIEVTFSEGMQVTAGLTLATNYTFSGPTVITAHSVTVHSLTKVRVVTLGSMNNGAAYFGSVGPPYTDILDNAGNVLDPVGQPYEFVGIGSSVASASATVAKTVEVTFSDAVYASNPAGTYDALNPANYVFTSGTGIVRNATSVALLVASPTRVNVSLDGDMTNGESYTVTVNNVRTLSDSELDPNYATFTGYAVLPTVSKVESRSLNLVRVTFDKSMLETTQIVTPAKYRFVCGATTVYPSYAVYADATHVDLRFVTALVEGSVYTMTVMAPLTGIQDVSWNNLSPTGNAVGFTVDVSAAIIWVSPSGNDSMGDGSYSSPYLTIERALHYFTNKDQIRLMDGTYTPTETIVVSGLEGSIFSETAYGATIQPQHVSEYNAAIAILNSPRFLIQGVSIAQSADVNHRVGIYADNVQNLIVYTCAIRDFESDSGNITGIFARGSGRIDNCHIENIDAISGSAYGIVVYGLTVMDCAVHNLVSRSATAKGIQVED